MIDLEDTIVALSSAAGPGARGIVRVTGNQSWSILQECFRPENDWPPSIRRGRWLGTIRIPEFSQGVPGHILVWPAPRTYTGQDLIEIHTLSSPPIIEALIAHLLQNGGRAARPGEFTLRAFLAGKLDLTQAEAVLGVIDARNTEELKTALGQLAGGMARPLQGLREELLGLLAEVEAGLDFSEEDLQFISREQLLGRLAGARKHLEDLQEQLDRRNVSGRAFRVVLAGPPNAGKSSLFNALAGKPAALVSPEAGTTRDYLVQRIQIGGVEIDLIDTAGTGETRETIARQAQALRKQQIEEADLILLCQDLTCFESGEESGDVAFKNMVVLRVGTKCDLAASAPLSVGGLSTSAITGHGLNQLRKRIAELAVRSIQNPALAPSWSRCRHHVAAAIGHVRQAEAIIDHREPPELLALELRLALDQIGEMVGAVYTDDLLDRIFGQFCIGK